MRSYVLIFCFTFLISGALCSSPDIHTRLKQLKGVSVEIIPGSFTSTYKLLIDQPIDHENPWKGSFRQRVFLSHADVNKPVVFFINGYIAPSNVISDWTTLLGANQVYVEHRYYGESMPGNTDWTTLNLKNATADLHRIRVLLGEIYKHGWISTGISKGGLTAVSYKYLYPEDVKATIAQSTSVKTIPCDTAFFTFIDSISLAADCKDKIISLQRLMLAKKAEIIPHLKSFLDSKGKRYEKQSIERTFELAVLEIPFSLFQNRSGCSALNLSDTTAPGLFNTLRTAVNDWFNTDDVFQANAAFGYQAATELGYYCYPTKHFRDLLPRANECISPLVLPGNAIIIYSNKLMTELRYWLENKGDNIIYINGGQDPYSLYKIIPSGSVSSISYTLPGNNHNQVSFRHLSAAQQAEVVQKISLWLENE
jgi:hypothetical protein